MTDTEAPPVDKRWGNPAHVTFAKNYVRLAAADDLRVKVNKVIVPIVERLLTDLSAKHLAVEELEGHPLVPLGDGFRLVLRNVPSEGVATALSNYGFFPAEEPDVYRWRGTFDEATSIGEALDAAVDAEIRGSVPGSGQDDAMGDGPTDDPADDSSPVSVTLSAPASSEREAVREDEDWDDALPGLVDVGPGSVGRAVLFVQAYLDVPRTGVYDEATRVAVESLQLRSDVAPNGIVGWETWRAIVTRLHPRLTAGDAGRNVRVLSAALIAAGEVERDAPVHLRYGIVLAREVRAFQERHGIRPTGRTGGIEWGMLVGSPYDGAS